MSAESESKIQAAVRAVLSQRDSGARVWRNNVGQDQLTHVRYGLGVGSADLVGIYRKLITQEDVGTLLGQFLACEIKTPVGKLSKEQTAWLKNIREFGGIAEVIRSETEAREFLSRLTIR